jgi:hypothetical protein
MPYKGFCILSHQGAVLIIQKHDDDDDDDDDDSGDDDEGVFSLPHRSAPGPSVCFEGAIRYCRDALWTMANLPGTWYLFGDVASRKCLRAGRHVTADGSGGSARSQLTHFSLQGGAADRPCRRWMTRKAVVETGQIRS